MKSCLADELIFDFVCGALSDGERSSVDSHLDTCLDCRMLVAGVSQTEGHVETREVTSGLCRGSLVGRYVLVEVVGQGAMGIVFAGYDPSLHRKAAIKILHTEGGQSQLLREAQAMASLSHPNVVTIYETGRVGESVYLAMELLPGETLSGWLGRGDCTLAEVREAFGQAGRGLQAAHNAGLVHRDFKPDNVLVSADGLVRVTDFGLARGRIGSADDGVEVPDCDFPARGQVLPQTITQTGAILGTPAYMAPEQLRGEGASASSDQYAFCVAYYEALYGRRPFSGKNMSELLKSADNDEIGAKDAKFSVPRDLHEVIARGLHPDSDKRFGSMSELLDALSLTERPKMRLWKTAAVVVAGLGIAMGIVFWAKAESSTESRCQRAENIFGEVWTPQLQAKMDSALGGPAFEGSETLVVSLRREFGDWRDDWISQHRETCEATRVSGEQSEAVLDLRMQCLKRGLASFSALGVELASVEHGGRVELSELVGALPDLQSCQDSERLSQRVTPTEYQRDRVDKVEAGVARIVAHLSTAKFSQAALLSGDLVEEAIEVGHLPTIAGAAFVAAKAHRQWGQIELAKQYINESITASMELGSDRDLSLAWIESVSILGEAAAYNEALRNGLYAQASLRRIRKSPILESALANNVGVVYYHLGLWDEAREYLQQSLSIRTTLFGAGDTRVAKSYTNLGNLARALGNPKLALQHHEKAYAIDERVLGLGHPTLGRHFHNQAGALRLMGEGELALGRYRKALVVKEAALGASHPEVALTQNSLGLIHAETGDLAAARKYYQSSLQSYQSMNHPDRALSLFGLASIDANSGQSSAATRNFRAALSIFVESHTDSHDKVTRALLALSSSLLAEGERAQALELLRRAETAGNRKYKGAVTDALASYFTPRTKTGPEKGTRRKMKIDSPGMYSSGRSWN